MYYNTHALKFYQYLQLYLKILITYELFVNNKHRNIKSPDSPLASTHPVPIKNLKKNTYSICVTRSHR